MYSFNIDYIFNIVYNILLAIRYAILFWILRIHPANYLEDHKYDAWDGLRDRGWIRMPSTQNVGGDPNSNIVYLGGNSGTDSLSWWDVIKHNVFGWGNNNVGSIQGGNSGVYGLNPADVNYAAQKVSNDPWFANLKFSVQNPILAFLADMLTILAFFVLLILIYSVMQWLFITITPISRSKEESRRKQLEEQKDLAAKRFIELEKLKAEEKRQEKKERKEERKVERVIDKLEDEKIKEFKKEKAKEELEEERIDNSMPAGIPGLPIDESSLSKEEVKEIKKEENILLNYKTKNILPEKENQVLKIKKEDIKEEKKIELTEEEKRRILLQEERREWYKNRWNIVIGYMEGGEEALWRIGVLEADNLLDDLLTDRGYMGLTMADKLKQAKFNTIDLAWNAHKIRNRIAHDGSRFVLTDRIARNTIELYRAVFKEFKVFE